MPEEVVLETGIRDGETDLALSEGNSLSLPYRIEGIAIETTPARQGENAEVTVGLTGAPDTGIVHVLRFEFVRPDGEISLGMTQKRVAQGRACAIDVPIAWNDPVGTWRVQVTDVVTGTSAEVPLEIKGR